MHEDLIGYLLGALEPHEMQRISERLQVDEELREQLADVEASLRPLEQNFEPPPPVPSDLVARTLDQLPPLPGAGEIEADDQDVAPESGVTAANQSVTPVHDPDQKSTKTLPMTGTGSQWQSRGLAWRDILGLAIAASVVLALLVPHVLETRLEARRITCQDQLRDLGVAITQYVNQSEHGRLPAVEPSGPEAFAGVYAVRLRQAGLIEDETPRWCPTLEVPTDNVIRFMELNELPTVAELRTAPIDQLKRFQRYAGGHYAYSLGVMEQEGFRPPRFEARSSFAVLSDAPMAGTPTKNNYRETLGHRGDGINVLFEDGRVEFVSVDSLEQIPDHPLFNHHGAVEAGVNVDDAALAPSWRGPFIEVRQR